MVRDLENKKGSTPGGGRWRVPVPLSVLAIVSAALAVFAATYYGLLTGEMTFSHDTYVWKTIFFYYVDALAAGEFPYWDPYLISGTPFYPNIALHGLLDPIVLLFAALARVFSMSLVTCYNYFRIYKLLIVCVGAFLVYRKITKDNTASAVASCILFLVFPLSYFRQFGTIDAIYLTPLILYCVLSFLESPSGPRRYLFLSLIALAAGISMINYIPSFFVFDLICFVVAALAFRLIPARSVLAPFRNRRLLVFAAALACAVACMAAPPVTVLKNDASGNGDLFPMQRVVQQSGQYFVRLVASDMGTNNLSNRFTSGRAAMNSWGEVANLLFPDRITFPYWREHDLQSEVDHYIGVIPLVLAVAGVLFVRSRYRWLLLSMTAVHFINGFSWRGFNSQEYNLLQRVFNALFPPLTWYQGRMNLGYFVLFYLCAFAALGLKAFLDDDPVIRNRMRFLAGVCASFALAKVAVTYFLVGGRMATSAYDAFVLVQLLVFAAGLVLVRGGKIPLRALTVVAVVFTFADLCYYNANAGKYSMHDSEFDLSTLKYAQSIVQKNSFEYFLAPFLRQEGPAMQESMAKTKGALSAGYNHSLFTTKRFYDVFLNVPLQTQFALGGMVYPIVQFFPTERALLMPDRQRALLALASVPPIPFHYPLYLEAVAGPGEKPATFDSPGSYEQAIELRDYRVKRAYEQFVNDHWNTIYDVRQHLPGFLGGSVADVAVETFSRNSMTVKVRTSADGYLYYGDGWSRYWKAYDNGLAVPLWIANYNGKAVHVTAGDHRIRFEFDPMPYRLAIYAYYMGLGFIAAALGWSLRPRRGAF